MKSTLHQLAAQLADGTITSRALIEAALERIAAPGGEGARVFTATRGQAALAEADAIDAARARGAHGGPFSGIPVSIKDLFDVAGETTTAGSVLLTDAPPAEYDAAAVARLRGAGFVPIGRTNMTEFAFSGLGLNPHYGTPKNPWQREVGRIPGGSSSGAAISITDGMAFGALGTDTGGSCRIPAALCGIVGFKPTAARVPAAGAFPLSTSLDSIGAMAASVACCAALFDVLSGAATQGARVVPADLSAARFLVPQHYVVEDLDASVAHAFAQALEQLSRAGATLIEVDTSWFHNLPLYNVKGGFPAAEGYYAHRRWLAADEAHAGRYDPRVRTRLLRGRDMLAADYLQLLDERNAFIARVTQTMTGFDAILFPTTPQIAPPIAPLADSDELFAKINLLMLRNSTVVNFFDGCAVSVPIHEPGSAPVGLTIAGTAHRDEAVFALAAAVEALFV